MITSHGKMKKLYSHPLPGFPLGLEAEFTPPPAVRLLPTIHLIQPEPPLESTPPNSKNNILILVIVQSLPDGEGNWTNSLHRENSMCGNRHQTVGITGHHLPTTPAPVMQKYHSLHFPAIPVSSVLSCRHILQSANPALPKAVSKLPCPPFLCYLLIMLLKCTW